ncbi:MAG TPA: hypothetical protein VGL40_06035, partial [Bacillota bacterium]
EGRAGRDSGDAPPEIKVIAESVVALGTGGGVGGGGEPALHLRLADVDPAAASADVLAPELRRLLQAHPGKCPVFLHLGQTGRVIRLKPAFWVDGRETLLDKLSETIGADNVRHTNPHRI